MTNTAVVTGAGSGIGRAVARRLSDDGYRVALVGRRRTALDDTATLIDGEPLVTPGDMTDPDAVARVTDHVVDAFGSVDVVVHCAGGGTARPDDSLTGLRRQLLDTYEANLVSTALLTEALSRHITDDRGRVVAVSSIAALRGGGLAYAASKAALHGWAFTAAGDLGPRGITVNVIAPGYIVDTEFFGDSMTTERHERLVAQTMNHRAGHPEDVAALVAGIVTPDAGHVTAQVLQVNGGALAR